MFRRLNLLNITRQRRKYHHRCVYDSLCVGRCACPHLNLFISIIIAAAQRGFMLARTSVFNHFVCVTSFVPQGYMCVRLPRPAAGPEAPVPAELCASGYPGTLQALNTSAHTMSDSPSNKQRFPSPLTETQTHSMSVQKQQVKLLTFCYVWVQVLTLSSSTVKVWSQACSPTVLQTVWPTTVLSSFSTALTSAAHATQQMLFLY